MTVLRDWRRQPLALNLFIGGLAVTGSAALIGGLTLSPLEYHPSQLWRLGAVFGLMFIAWRWPVLVRLRTEVMSYSTADVTFILGLTLLPSPLLIPAAAAGTVLAYAADTRNSAKTTFSFGQSVLAVSAGWLVFGWLDGFRLDTLSAQHLLALAAGGLAYIVVNEAATSTVVALAQHVKIRTVLFRAQGRDQVVLLINLLIGTALSALASLEPLAVLFVPLAILGMHWVHNSSVRLREHEDAFKQLEEVTHALNRLDVEEVLAAVVDGAAGLFRAEYVEIVLADGTHVSGAGRNREAPPPDSLPAIVHAPLRAAGEQLGEIRLRYASKVSRLTAAEERTFSTLAAVAGVSIANARQHEKIRRDAVLDPLTELPNRRALMAAVTAGLAADPTTIGLLLVDLNRFKEVNDTLGHTVGDRLLCEVARRLDAAVGADGRVHRLGGDEFAVLVPSGVTDKLTAVAERIQTRMARPVRLDSDMSRAVTMTVAGSIGIATTDSDDANELLRRADVAMYRAKANGGGIDHYDPDSDSSSLHQLLLEEELRIALDDPAQILVEFQPQLDVSNGAPVGAEALVRWKHPTYGVLPASVVVPAVARAGLDIQLIVTVLDQALAARARWLTEQDLDVRVAVNLSPKAALDNDLPVHVAALLERHRTPADRLVLELPETVATTDLDAVEGVLVALHELGVQIALDDFGTGGAPLTMLARLPVDEVKIDRSFVQHLIRSSTSAAIVRATVDLAHSLGLRAVGVGVGSLSLDRMLREVGCDAAQGNFYSPPVDADAAGALLAAAQTAAHDQHQAEVVRLSMVRRRPS